MDHYMKDNITIIRKLDMEERYIKKVITMKDLGQMINVMGKDFLRTKKMDLDTRDIGLKVMLKAKVKKYGQMVLNL